MLGETMVAFWLLPKGEGADVLVALVHELAARYDAPVFTPHLTVGAGATSDERALEILQNLSIREPIELEITEVKFSAEYTKTLYLQCRPQPEIEALAAELQHALQSDYLLNPHLSLLYQELPAAEKAIAADALTFPFASIRFETVAAIVTPAAIRTREDVEAWRALASRRLDGASE